MFLALQRFPAGENEAEQENQGGLKALPPPRWHNSHLLSCRWDEVEAEDMVVAAEVEQTVAEDRSGPVGAA